MKGFIHAGRLSEAPFIRRLQERFGLTGYARWMKALELAALADPAAPGVVSIPWADWCAVMDCDGETLGEFLAFAEAEKQVTRQADGSVTFVGFSALIPADVFLFTSVGQLVNWCGLDLGFPGWLLEQHETLRLFARWVASNVTREELEAAAQAAATTSQSLQPAVLHEQLQRIRRERIEAAKL